LVLDGAFLTPTTPDRSSRGRIIVFVRITSNGDVRILLEGPTTPNSFEWSIDGETFCLTASRVLWSTCHDYDPQPSSLENRLWFAIYGTDAGRPDSTAMDADGGLEI
jgi:sugar lactone lactonase YvrE